MRVSVGSVADSIFDMNDSITNMKFHIGDCYNPEFYTKPFYEWIPDAKEIDDFMKSIGWKEEWNDPEGFETKEESMKYEEEYRKRLNENSDILSKKINEALKMLW